jgi:uncharacterized DUF497 family protein
MEFEYDLSKSMSNLAKHGISFADARHLWRDPAVLIIKAREAIEARWIAIGRVGQKHWSAVFTYREDRIRIISVRRSRAKEIALYES